MVQQPYIVPHGIGKRPVCIFGNACVLVQMNIVNPRIPRSTAFRIAAFAEARKIIEIHNAPHHPFHAVILRGIRQNQLPFRICLSAKGHN